MKKPLLVFLAALACVCAVPQPASAGAAARVWRWLDRLSGPEGFWGIGAEFAFVCYGTRTIGGAHGLHLDPGCYDLDRSKRPIVFGVQVAFLDGDNTLEYAPPQSDSPPDVSAVPLMGTVDIGLHPRNVVDVGMAAGAIRFAAGSASFWRAAVEPRVTVRPLVLLAKTDSGRRKSEFLEVRLSALGIFGTIDAADFGATGDFRATGELIPCISAIVDIGRLISP